MLSVKKRIYISILLLSFTVLWTSLWSGVYFAYYLFDNEGFVEVFCENKNTPELHCDGKCKLAELANEEDKSIDFNFKKFETDFCWIVQQVVPFLVLNEENSLKHTFHYKNPYSEKIYFSIFHPPLCG